MCGYLMCRLRDLKYFYYRQFCCMLAIHMLLWKYYVILVTAGKVSVAMDTTEELFRSDEENKWRENESWGAYKEEDDTGATKWSSERDENEIKTRASDEWPSRIRVWEYRAIVQSNKQIAAYWSKAKQVWSSHSTSDSEEEDHIDDNVKEQK